MFCFFKKKKNGYRQTNLENGVYYLGVTMHASLTKGSKTPHS